MINLYNPLGFKYLISTIFTKETTTRMCHVSWKKWSLVHKDVQTIIYGRIKMIPSTQGLFYSYMIKCYVTIILCGENIWCYLKMQKKQIHTMYSFMQALSCELVFVITEILLWTTHWLSARVTPFSRERTYMTTHSHAEGEVGTEAG